MDKANVAHEGGKRRVKGKKHENIRDLATVWVQLVELGVAEMEAHRQRRKDEALLQYCPLDWGGCTPEDLTIVIDLREIDFCPYQGRRTTLSEVDLEW